MAKALTNEEVIQVWSKVVDVQMHFNSIAMTVRNIFVTLILAVVAAIGLSVKEGLRVHLLTDISLGTVLALVAVVITCLFYFMDRNWYHRLLIGSVEAALDLEKHLTAQGAVPVNLTGRIGANSPVTSRVPKPLRKLLWWMLFTDDRYEKDGNPRYRYIEDGKIHSEAKIAMFYKSVIILLIIIAVAAHFVRQPVASRSNPEAAVVEPVRNAANVTTVMTPEPVTQEPVSRTSTTLSAKTPN